MGQDVMKMDDTSLFYRDLFEIVATDPVDADAKVKVLCLRLPTTLKLL